MPATAPASPDHTLGKREVLLLALVLVAAHHAIPFGLVFGLLPARELYDRLGRDGFANLCDALSALAPLLLCLGAPMRSGLILGAWKGRAWKVLGICILPVALTAVIYPLTSQPFKGERSGVWLISPAAQDLLFTGYLFGLLDAAFPGAIGSRVRQAVILTAVFFALWHVPNFWGLNAAYVAFQLTYTLLGGAWVLLARQLTGSILPGIATHMAVNFVSWVGW